MRSNQLVHDRLPNMIRLRHRLHQIPELGFEEFLTAKLIREELSRLGIAHIAGVTGALTATVAWVGDTNKPCIALRADIDALPIVEQTGLAYASTHPGRMHACGHDGHTATLLGAAAAIQQVATDLPCCVKFLFQPAEEGGGGAARLVAAGVLDGRIGPKVDAVFGLHGWPSLPVGVVATKPGSLKAATDRFAATFVGRGGHGAYPHTTRDPIVAAAEAVLSLQQVVSREVDPTDAAVVTIGMIQAGTAVNVIPDTATIEGTARTLVDATRRQVHAAIERRCQGVAAAHDCECRFQWKQGYPPVINDAAMTDYFAKSARRALGADGFLPAARASMGGEDFAYYLEQVPGCFFLLGVRPPEAQTYPWLHSDRYDFTDAALEVGAKVFVALAENWNG